MSETALSSNDGLTELMIIRVKPKFILFRLMATFGWRVKYYILRKSKVIETPNYLQYKPTVFIDSAKDIWVDSAQAEDFLKTLNNEFLLHDTIGRTDGYTATLSRYLPSQTMAIDKLREESLQAEKMERSRMERY